MALPARTRWTLLTYVPLSEPWRFRRNTRRIGNEIMDIYVGAFPENDVSRWDGEWPRDPDDLLTVWQLHVAALNVLMAMGRGVSQAEAIAVLNEHAPDV